MTQDHDRSKLNILVCDGVGYIGLHISKMLSLTGHIHLAFDNSPLAIKTGKNNNISARDILGRTYPPACSVNVNSIH